MNHQALYELIVKKSYQSRNSVYIFEVEDSDKNRKQYHCHGRELLDKITDLEKEALLRLEKQKRILDVGAGPGRISKYLREKGYDVTALEKSKTICKILKKRSVKEVVNANFFSYFPKKKYDIVLLAGVYSIFGRKKEGIGRFVAHVAKNILNQSGRLIFILKDTQSGKTEITKRRFIFHKKNGEWFVSLQPSLGDILVALRHNKFLVEKIRKETNSQNYFLILKLLKDSLIGQK